MCDNAMFEDGTMCETQGKLKKRLGVDTLPNATGDDHCLCPIDFKHIEGWRVSKNDPDGEYAPFSVWFYPVAAKSEGS